MNRDEDTAGPSPKLASGRYQSGSDEPSHFSETAESSSQAYVHAVSKSPDEQRERDGGLRLPGPDELDEQTGRLADEETRFNRDAWGGQGNPQVSIRLRPGDFERLGRAADLYGVRRTTLARMMVIRGVKAILEGELRRKGEFFRER